MDKSNYVSLSGALVKDAIIRKNDKGSDYVLFTLSVPQTGTKWYDYINCIAFNENAAIISKNPLKGPPYHIEGRIHTSSFDRNGKKHYSTDVVAEKIEVVKQDD